MNDLPINGRRPCKDRVPTPTCPLFQKLFLAKRKNGVLGGAPAVHVHLPIALYCICAL